MQVLVAANVGAGVSWGEWRLVYRGGRHDGCRASIQ